MSGAGEFVVRIEAASRRAMEMARVVKCGEPDKNLGTVIQGFRDNRLVITVLVSGDDDAFISAADEVCKAYRLSVFTATLEVWNRAFPAIRVAAYDKSGGTLVREAPYIYVNGRLLWMDETEEADPDYGLNSGKMVGPRVAADEDEGVASLRRLSCVMRLSEAGHDVVFSE